MNVTIGSKCKSKPNIVYNITYKYFLNTQNKIKGVANPLDLEDVLKLPNVSKVCA